VELVGPATNYWCCSLDLSEYSGYLLLGLRVCTRKELQVFFGDSFFSPPRPLHIKKRFGPRSDTRAQSSCCSTSHSVDDKLSKTDYKQILCRNIQSQCPTSTVPSSLLWQAILTRKGSKSSWRGPLDEKSWFMWVIRELS
jgi:hypothetical protein